MANEEAAKLVDLNALAAWMDSRGLGSGPLEEIVPLAGGTQNILLAFTRSGRRYVLRRPPSHPTANGNDTMRKEMRVLAALGGTDVPHPGLIASCPEEDVLGAAFYLMEPVDGFNATVSLPPLHASDPAIRRQMGFALIDGILALGRVDHVAVGLEGLGKLDNFLERQVPRWLAQLDSYSKHEGWTGRAELPDVDGVARWLDDNRPKSFRPGIMHGDYHLANVMYRHDGPELAAIVDWELATIGDPLIDLGWVLCGWPEDGASPVKVTVTPWDGFPKADELIAHYRAGSDRDLSAIDWYTVLACFKLGILLEGSHARACAGKADKTIGDRLHGATIELFQRANRLIAG